MTNKLRWRTIPALAVLLAPLAADPAAAGPASSVPALKAEATVSGEVVRLGDLVDNAGHAAAIPAFHAPGLGMSGTVQAHRVIALAREHGLAHLDAGGLHEVVVIRVARTIALGELERAVAEAAARHLGLGDTDNLAIGFDRDVRPLLVESDATDPARIAQFSYDARRQRFEGLVEVPGSLALRRQPVRVSGTLIETAEALVLARALARGEAVRESDLLAERRPRAELPADALRRPAAAIGQAARRALRAGQILRPADLMKPDLVARNDMVTILFERPGITLTARGKALAAGAEGDVIAVLNPQSKRVLHATVERPGLVVIGRTGAATADATGSVR